MPNVIADLFHDRPRQWGLRGDRFLWDEMQDGFVREPVPRDNERLRELLANAFRQLTGARLDDTCEMVKVERFDHGGMSSGWVYLPFWSEVALPLLAGRARQLHQGQRVTTDQSHLRPRDGIDAGPRVRVAAWNVNHRVGMTRFRAEAAEAAMALGAEVIVLNEFHPGRHEQAFCLQLSDAGWCHQVMSPDTGERANHVLIASCLPLRPVELTLPDFDRQFPANVAAAAIPAAGITLLGVRMPMYQGATAPLLPLAWDWLECTARNLAQDAAVIVGDLNTSMAATGSRRRPQFHAILASNWRRAEPAQGPSWFGRHGLTSEIDHALHTARVGIADARFVRHAGGYCLAGADNALSDHAALRLSMYGLA